MAEVDLDTIAKFRHIMQLEAKGARCGVYQYQFAEKTVELVVESGSSVYVWQYPQSYWDRYLIWKQTAS